MHSHRGVQFRRWATAHFKSYLVKGFVLDDERFKRAGDDAYFDERGRNRVCHYANTISCESAQQHVATGPVPHGVANE